MSIFNVSTQSHTQIAQKRRLTTSSSRSSEIVIYQLLMQCIPNAVLIFCEGWTIKESLTMIYHMVNWKQEVGININS